MYVQKPIPIVDKWRTMNNIKSMVTKTRASGITLRPHFKTHISAAIGEWFREFDVSSITVSSVDMAEYFAEHTWNDIMICIPANVHEITKMNALAKSLTLHLVVDSLETLRQLGGRMTQAVNLWIEIDVGHERTGIPSLQDVEIVNLAHTIQSFSRLEFTGIATHAGHSYHAQSIAELQSIYYDQVRQMTHVKDALSAAGFSNLEVSVGDTPTCSIMDTFGPPITDIRPGTFVFYDLRQMTLGACTEDDIAMTVACPVISKHPERNELIIYGGSASLSKEMLTLQSGDVIYGLIAIPDAQTGRTAAIPGVYVSSLSQEHGTIKGPPSFINHINIGDTLLVLPIHACMTTQFHRAYRTLNGETLRTLRF
jgi:D-serine deaminase-like pyridoxal phosphate-dependent protein